MAVAEVRPPALLASSSQAVSAWASRSGGTVARWLAAFRGGGEARDKARREAELAAAQAGSLCRTDTATPGLLAAAEPRPASP
jgi:hypothetical protein